MGSEMCIRDSSESPPPGAGFPELAGPVPLSYLSKNASNQWVWACLLYTSDAADERSSVDLGGRRIIKKKNKVGAGGEGSDRMEEMHRSRRERRMT